VEKGTRPNGGGDGWEARIILCKKKKEKAQNPRLKTTANPEGQNIKGRRLNPHRQRLEGKHPKGRSFQDLGFKIECESGIPRNGRAILKNWGKKKMEFDKRTKSGRKERVSFNSEKKGCFRAASRKANIVLLLGSGK